MPAFGTGVNASLGRIDYTPYLQGSLQGSSAIGRGISQLGQEAGIAVKQYYENKQTDDLFNATTESVKKALKTDPYLAQTINIQDPNDTKAIGVAIKAFGGGDKRAGVAAVTKMLAQHGEQKVEDQAIGAAMKPFVDETKRLEAYLGAGGRDLIGFQTRMAQLEASKAAAENSRSESRLRDQQAKSLSEKPSPEVPPIKLDTFDQPGENGIIYTVTFDTRTGKQVSITPKIPSNMVMKDGVPTLMEGTKEAQVLKDQQIKEQEKQQKNLEEAKNIESQKEDARNDLNITIDNVNKAIDLLKKGAGGAGGGTAAGAWLGNVVGQSMSSVGLPDFNLSASEDLRNTYEVIRNATALQTAMKYKSLSKTGASPVGQASDKDFAALGQSATFLNPTLPEDQQKIKLETLLGHLTRSRNALFSDNKIKIEEVK